MLLFIFFVNFLLSYWEKFDILLERMKKRPPVIVVVGHVDHGKTTILDYIKKTNVAAREAGGITQAIGAYEIEHKGQKMTFIDTPGHEAFSMMRERGGKVADIAILIVAGDEGVRSQTKEAFETIKKAEIPFVVAVTKMDKPGADVNRVINDLFTLGVLLEGMGGDISYKPVSAMTGEGVDELLDLLLFVAEVEGITYDETAPGKGFILESHLDNRRGVVAAVIARDGVIRVGDSVLFLGEKARIKMMEDSSGKQIKEAVPSTPFLLLGFPKQPKVGEEFLVGGEVKTVEETEMAKEPTGLVTRKDQEKKFINLILKANDAGSLEALSSIIKALPVPDKSEIKIIDQAVGDITDGNLKIAMSTRAIVIGFKVKMSKAAEIMQKAYTEETQVKVFSSEIVYELIKNLEDWLTGNVKRVEKGRLEVLATFGAKGEKQVVGGKVIKGEVVNNAKCEIERKGVVIGEARLINLQQNKVDAVVVTEGNECGMMVKSVTEILKEDFLVFY